MRLQICEDGEVCEVARGGGRRVARWKGGRFLVLFNAGGCRTSVRLHAFVFNVNQRNDGARWVLDFLAWLQGWENSAYTFFKLLKNIEMWECVEFVITG